MTVEQIRRGYLEYYSSIPRSHEVIPSANLVPENDPTTLFTGSGMQPMLPYLLGEPYPSGNSRITDSQKCFRTADIEEVGDNRHTTLFEMLGNWSFGDYWKEEQLSWLFEFLTEKLNLDPDKLFVSVFIGDSKNGLEKDTDSVGVWKRLFAGKNIEAKVVDIGSVEAGGEKGMEEGRIFYYEAKKNWWSRSGAPDLMPIGEPGGPDSEVFYLFDQVEHDPKFGKNCHPNCDCGRFLEIANSVFMEFKKVGEGKFEKLPKRNVDFGGGLERILAAVLNEPDFFKTDAFSAIITEIETLTGKKYEGENIPPMRVIADHIKAATFLIKDGVRPGNKAQGYFLRRLIRRATIKLHQLSGSLDASSLFTVADKGVLNLYDGVYFDRNADRTAIESVLVGEAEQFSKSLDKGLKVFHKSASLDGKTAFDLYQTYGFPLEITLELAAQNGIKINVEEFKKEFEKHKELSRTASSGMFKGGLGDTSEKTIWFHTLTHLLHKSLRDILGEHVHQAGSNITPERLRFDFTHPDALTESQIKEVEDLVNTQKDRNLEVSSEAMSLEEALNSGALAFFKEKYGQKVTVYSVGEFSKEICGGPHVKNTSEIKGSFKIVSEKSSSAGVRRIKAVLV
uniref:alanine--tRNA ligase n=1 Tax=candidate division WWE3 bacterium TaxID=2053526 RepID=A0A7C4TPE3_UNCKA